MVEQPRWPAWTLTEPQRTTVGDVPYASRFADQAPAEIYATLLGKWLRQTRPDPAAAALRRAALAAANIGPATTNGAHPSASQIRAEKSGHSRCGTPSCAKLSRWPVSRKLSTSNPSANTRRVAPARHANRSRAGGARSQFHARRPDDASGSARPRQRRHGRAERNTVRDGCPGPKACGAMRIGCSASASGWRRRSTSRLPIQMMRRVGAAGWLA